MSGFARKLASKEKSINIFILSMCRLEVYKNENGFTSHKDE
jgi:hypothetical protein